MPLTLSTFPLIPLSLYSAYALSLCYTNVTKLQKYEEKANKAAEWSDTAAQRLHKTRTTQTSGTLAVSFLPLCPSKSDIDNIEDGSLIPQQRTPSDPILSCRLPNMGVRKCSSDGVGERAYGAVLE